MRFQRSPDDRWRRGRLSLALTIALPGLLACPALSEPAPGKSVLRVGVPYLPPLTKSVEARLYTEDGFEIELARELGERLGRPVTLVRLDKDKIVPALSAGAVDIALSRQAPAEPSPVRTIPTGFSSGLAVSMRTDTVIHRWEDLAGRLICVAEANEPARLLAESFGARVRLERAPARALMHVRTGDCDAAIHDQALLEPLFGNREWKKFSATLPATAPTELRALLAPAGGPRSEELTRAVAALGSSDAWGHRVARWAANVAFEVYLDQEAPDCH